MLAQHFLGGPHALLPLAGDIEDVREVGIEREFLHRNLLRQAETIELADSRFHLIDGDVGAAATPDGVEIPDLSRHAIDVLELGQRVPAFVALAPLRAGREPDRKRFCEIFVRMLLGIPPGHVANKLPRERDGAVIIAIGAAKRTEEIAPLRRLVELVGVIERVPGLMTQVHHDLARVFEVIHIALQLGQVGVGQVEGNADDGLAGGASPFIGEIAMRTEFVDAFGFQFPIELLDESFEGRTLEFEPEFANGPGEYLLEFGLGFLESAHWAIQSSIPRRRIWHGQRIACAHSVVGTPGLGSEPRGNKRNAEFVSCCEPVPAKPARKDPMLRSLRPFAPAVVALACALGPHLVGHGRSRVLPRQDRSRGSLAIGPESWTSCTPMGAWNPTTRTSH